MVALAESVSGRGGVAPSSERRQNNHTHDLEDKQLVVRVNVGSEDWSHGVYTAVGK